ncbi:ABC-type multidrug transport system fused ATPase/permease subunit [Kibdelosporangium banguiense]|uniref:ABC-type multidrug transport system fused ATPase/permease subunit n=1 Tax=Kibdelosporangium banguiense TaxID=1365924 RepID=A0ABS4TCM3_9PSEU|nr:ABC transporter ATP-binding protein [Kibdelosporangium banguiense]MBP2322084.1 ABC-type multidrug transport system fused ATPase/permease subunit [Kibdelosporangium banguiense]
MVFGALWMVPLALVPLAIGKAIDEGIAPRDTGSLLTWTGLILGLGVLLALSNVVLTRAGDRAWLDGASLMQQAVLQHATRVGAALPKKIKTGEIVAVGSSDLYSIAGLLEVIGRLTGAVASFVVVAIALLSSTPILGLVVLIGVPLATLGFIPLLGPLRKRTEAHREEVGAATAMAADIVSGLRILRGIGGEKQFTDRFAETSQRVRKAGVNAARIDSWLSGIEVFLPGLVTVVVLWLGARLALDGTISVGELVAFYGVSAFLVVPVSVATEAAHHYNEATVAARRACEILRLTPGLESPADPKPLPSGAFGLRDELDGYDCPAGQLTVINTTGSDAVADRLGRYVDAPVFADGIALRDADITEIRDRILVAHNQDVLFSGKLADEVDMGRSVDLRTALWAADAMDVVDGLEHGTDEYLAERGRTLSGGQRQRMLLARALSFDADVLVLDEPTSAVDAHTEARIVRRVAELRRGRTTVVLSQSPLWTNIADKVYAP